MPDAMQWEDRIVQTELGGRILNDALPAPLQRLAPGTAVRVTVEPFTLPVALGGGMERCSACGGPVMRCECCTTPGFDMPPASAPGGAVGEYRRKAAEDAVHDEGAMWLLLRNILSQGKDIHLDYIGKDYEEYSARVDAAARERASDLFAALQRARAEGEAKERERCARWAAWIAEMMERGAGECAPGERLRQVESAIREGRIPLPAPADEGRGR